MFARSNFVQNSLSKVQGVKEKTDDELLQEYKDELNRKDMTVDEEFGTVTEHPLWNLYGRLSFFCRTFTKGDYEGFFTAFIVLAIILAGVLVGIDTYDEVSVM